LFCPLKVRLKDGSFICFTSGEKSLKRHLKNGKEKLKERSYLKELIRFRRSLRKNALKEKQDERRNKDGV